MKKTLQTVPIANRADDDMLNEQQAARIVGLTAGTLRVQRSRQLSTQPPYHKIGGAVRYRRSELEAWLADNLVSH